MLVKYKLYFPDSTRNEAAIDEKILRVEGYKATLEVQAEINGEMYVFVIIVSQLKLI